MKEIEKTLKKVKKIIKKIPVVSKYFSKVKHKLNGFNSKKNKFQYFKRIQVDNKKNFKENEIIRITNILNYTKISSTQYSADKYPAGYHTFEIFGQILEGQRNPEKRFSNLEINFKDKRVLDIGSNQGGMLFSIRDKIKFGVGIDFDPRMINAANRIACTLNEKNLHFYVFDLESEPLELISDFIPGGKIDIIFLLSVCMWIKNWKLIIDFSSKLAEQMVFESNGTVEQQREQEEIIKKYYSKVTLISDRSDDDPIQKKRKLFLCENPV